MSTRENGGGAGTHGASDGRAAADRGAEPSDDDVFALFPAEREISHVGGRSPAAPPTPHALHGWHNPHGRGRLATFFAAGLAVGIAGGVWVGPPAKRERSVSAPATERPATQELAKREHSAESRVTTQSPPTDERAPRGESLEGRGAMLAAGKANESTTAPSSPARISRPTPRQRVPPSAGSVRASRTRAQSAVPGTGLAGPAPPATASLDGSANGQRLVPTATRGEAVPEGAISVPVSAAASDPDGDELIFRWSAPVGMFLDPMAPETRYVCPKTPRPGTVMVTVTVTDARGAASSDTIAVRCGDAR